MGNRIGHTVAALAVLTIVVALSSAGAFARSVGLPGGEVVEPRPPSGKAADLGFIDLSAAPGGRLVAALGGFGGADYFGAARLSAKGKLDSSFGSGGYTMPVRLGGGGRGPRLRTHANSIVSLAGGKVLVGGYQYNGTGGTAPLLARYLADGRPDPSFGSHGIVAPRPASEGVEEGEKRGGGLTFDTAVGQDGSIVAAGAQNAFSGGSPAGLVLSYEADGRLDPSFGTGGRFVMPEARDAGYTAFGAVDALANGKVLVAGYLRGHLTVLRLTSAGALDRSFGGGDGRVTVGSGFKANCCSVPVKMAVAGGRIVVAGVITRHHEEPLLLAQLTSGGRLDRSFGSNGRVVGPLPGPDTTFFTPRALAVRGGRILLAGGHEVDPFVKGSPAEVMTVVALRHDGSVDTGFGERGVQIVEASREGAALAAAVRADGSVLIGGALYSVPTGQPKTGSAGYVPVLKSFPATP